MAIKGSATIELTNADGSKEVIKHDNMITNAINDMCVSQRGEMATILKMVNQNDSYAQTMFGGLLLFGETLNNDADDYTIPTANIVGYASQTAYAGLDLARGSFNQSEGGVQEDGSYKFVWDFGTAQGNGTIKSLALCPNIMGKIGASDTIVRGETNVGYIQSAPATPFNSSGRMLTDDGSTDGISNWCFNICAIVDDVAYAVDNYNLAYNSKYASKHICKNGGIFKLYKFKLGATEINLADKVARTRYMGSVDVKLPDTFINEFASRYTNGFGVFNTYFDHMNKRLILSPNIFKANVAVNGTLPYVDIDFTNNMSITEYTFTNTTPEAMIMDSQTPTYGDSAPDLYFYVVKDYIFVLSGTSKNARMYIVDRSNNTNIKKASFAGSDFVFPNYTYSGGGFTPYFVNKNVFVFRARMGGSSDYNFILDINTGIVKELNGVRLHAPTLNYGNDVVRISTGSYARYYPVINPFIITTKNNLDSPVTKTASQTMKITYTLAESEG